MVFRASDNDDPDADGYREMEFAIYSCTPNPRLLGGVTSRGDGRLIGPKITREKIVPEFVEFSGLVSTEYMDWGLYRKFKLEMLPLKNLWIYRVYLVGTNHALGYAPRANYDAGNLEAVSTNTLWNLTTDDPPGLCPLLVTLTDDPEPARDGALYTWNPVFESSLPRL